MSILIVEQAECLGAGMLARELVQHGARLHVVRRWRDEPLPPDMDGISGLVLCDHGPQVSVNGAELAGERRLVGAAQACGAPVVGLGFGARVVAVALGGAASAVSPADAAWEPLSLSHAGKEDPLLAGQPWRSTRWRWGAERIQTPPASARVLAGFGHECAAFAVGLRTYAFAFGWATGAAEFERGLQGFATAIPGDRRDAARAGWQQHGAEVERFGARLAERVVEDLLAVTR